MRKLAIGISALTALSLAGCGAEPAPELTDAEAVEMVEEARIIPAQGVAPQVIQFSDIERENLFGASCAFIADGDEGLIALAMAEVGAIKLDDKLLRLAPDAGSPELPYSVRQKYDGLGHSMDLVLEAGEGEKSGIETTDYGAKLTLRDASGQVIYEADGIAQCGV